MGKAHLTAQNTLQRTITTPVLPPYVDDPLMPLKRRLWNWGRWTRQGLGPNIGYPTAAPWAREWLPAKAWDSGWGDPSPPDPIPPPVNPNDAKRLDDAILTLRGTAHFVVIKRHYAHDWRQEREALDAACRALADLVGMF